MTELKKVRWIHCFVFGWHLDEVVGSRQNTIYDPGADHEKDLPVRRETFVMFGCHSCCRLRLEIFVGHWSWPAKPKPDSEVEELRKIAGLL